MVLNVVILSGGSGTRLWPLSRKKFPKQFLRLLDENLSMFQLTCKRILLLKPDNLFIICNKEHDFIVESQITELDIDISYKIITEPIGRNTAPAITVSTFLTDKSDDILVVPSDNVFDNEMFCDTVRKGLEVTQHGIVTFGINPVYPETGYGYINYDGNKLVKFVEKPNIELAKKYIESGKYLWNSGVFLFRNNIMTGELQNHCKDIYESVKKTLDISKRENNMIHLDKQLFEKVRDESIDYAVMEYHTEGLVISYNGKWSDIGSFNSLYNELDENKDIYGNVICGDVKTLDTKNCLIQSETGLITTIGLDNLIIINQKDVVFIADKSKSSEIKEIVKKMDRNEFIEHAKVLRPWGYYVNIEGNDNSGFKVKRISVYANKRLSLQSHEHRSEHWVIVNGAAKVQVGHDFLILNKNQHVYIPKNTLHRIENIGSELLEFVETQIGDYLGEDDITRYQDDFNRI